MEDDAFADGAPQQFPNVVDQLVQIDIPNVDDLFAAEDQQLTGQMRGAVDRGSDLFERFSHLRFDVLFLHQERGVTLDDTEQIVKVMSDAGGQLADGFHLLRLALLCLQSGPFGYIARGTAHRLFGADALQRGSAVVGQRLERVQVLLIVGPRRIALNG